MAVVIVAVAAALLGAGAAAFAAHTALWRVSLSSTRSPTPVPIPDRNGALYDPQTGLRLVVRQVVSDRGGDASVQPGVGEMFLMLRVRVRNRGTQPQTFNPHDVQLADTAGQTYSPTSFVPARYQQIASGTVAPGERHSGWIGFDVARTVRAVSVTWSDAGNLDPPRRVGRYRLDAVVQPGSNLDADIVTAVRAYELALHEVYGPGHSISMLGEAATGTALNAVLCTVQGSPASLVRTRTSLTYSGTRYLFREAWAHRDSGRARAHISQRVTAHHVDGTAAARNEDYAIAFALVRVRGAWKVSDYTWGGSDGSAGSAAGDSRACGR